MFTADRSIDRRITQQAESLEQAGWQVTIVAMPADEPEVEHPRIIRLGQGQAESMPVKDGGVLAVYKWLRRSLPMNSRLMMWLKAMAWRYFLDQEKFFVKVFGPAINQYRPAVFLAHDLPMLAVARAAAEHTGARLAYDSHELYCEQEFPDDVKRRWAAVEKKHISACDAVITVNESIAQELKSRYGLPEVSVVYNAERVPEDPVDAQARYFHEKFKLAADDKILLFQGGLSVGRNIETVVAAMALVQNSRVHLVLLGNGTLVQGLKQRINHLGLAGRVHFHAAVPQSDLLRLTAAADAGLIPYQAICLNNYYCTPNKLFEFIAVGLPVLGSDLPEIRRFVAGNDIGRVTALGTEQEIAAAIDGFFADAGQLQRWRENALNVRQQISWEHEGKKVVRIFKALVDK